MLAITGSNGKTTVTALTGALCRAAGLATLVAGNIGDAVLDALDGATAARVAGRLRARAVELPARNDVDRSRRRPRRCSTSPTIISTATPASPTTRRRRRASSRRRRADPQPRRSAHAWRCACPAALVQTFGAGVPQSEEAWGLVERGGERADDLARARRRSAHAGGELSLVGRHNALNALAALALASSVAKIDRGRAGGARRVPGPAAPDAARRRSRRRAVRQRLQGHDGRRDAGRARRHRRARSC